MKRAVFIGRWTPFHNGHLEIMRKKIEEGVPLLILVRDTPYDLYPPALRKRMIEAAMRKLKVDAKVMIIDDIESVNYGRGVGYEVNEIQVPDHIKEISATKIRKMIAEGNDEWKKHIPDGARDVLEKYMKQKGVVVWLTGLPKSGKKTIAEKAKEILEQRGINAEILNGSTLRNTVSRDLGFSKKDRETNTERAMHIAKMLARNGAVVLCSFVSPYRSQRRKIREEIEKDAHFIEVYVKTPLEVCVQRDKEGIYEKAKEGKIENFTGISDPYEEPESPEITIDTTKTNPEDAAEKIVEHVMSVV